MHKNSTLILFALLFFTSPVFAEINSEEVIALSKKFEPKAYAYAEAQGAEIAPTFDRRSFTLVWLPKDFDVTKDLVFVSLHGHQGWATKNFQIWHKHIAKKGWGFIGIQWWYGRSAESIGYAKPRDIYPWIREQLEERGIPLGNVVFEGYSMGGANSYAVAYLDRKQPEPYFGFIISNAGAMEEDYPPNRPILEEKDSLAGADWLLYCSVHDEQRPQSCERMEWTDKVLKEKGGTVHQFTKDPTGGHGGFMKDSVCEPALDLAERVIRG